MSSVDPQQIPSGKRRWTHPRPLLLPLCASLAVLLAGAAVAAPTLSSATREARGLDSSLTGISKLLERQVRPLSRRLAQGLPAEAERLKALREPASTTQDQVKVALDELRQMGIPATLDPHYVPALLAAGRAFLAASGQDPLTRTTVNPDYLGLESELAASEARLAGSAGVAARLAARARRLDLSLARTRRRADRLARILRRDPTARRRR